MNDDVINKAQELYEKFVATVTNTVAISSFTKEVILSEKTIASFYDEAKKQIQDTIEKKKMMKSLDELDIFIPPEKFLKSNNIHYSLQKNGYIATQPHPDLNVKENNYTADSEDLVSDMIRDQKWKTSVNEIFEEDSDEVYSDK